ncbi:MAG: radical SAM protein, partial [Anaerolineales bacterium]|nr:radical SAM protein [Anaerolineales bacterium]
MITEIRRDNLTSIRNSDFQAYANIYLDIYDNFIDQIEGTGIELDPHDYTQEAGEKIKQLVHKGAQLRNDGKSLFINAISPSCIACQKGVGSATYFISLNCHRKCFYCFNPNQENYAYFTNHERDVCAELEAQSKDGEKLKHIALTGGEPLLHEQETIAFFQTAKQHFPLAYTRLYTCGDTATEETLQALAGVGLDEIRFSIRMHD